MILEVSKEDEKLVYNILNSELSRDKERYKFFINSSKLKPLENSQFKKIDYISHIDGVIYGYFAYIFDKTNNKVTNVEVMSFENSPVLMRDFTKFCEELNAGYQNIELSIIPESPAYKVAKKCFEKFNFKRVGTLTSSVVLVDGKRYDIELWQKRGGDNNRKRC